MNEKLMAFYRYLNGKRIAMLGIGVSNAPLVRMFASRGAQVIACDKRPRAQLGRIADELEAAGAALKLGEDYLKDLNADIIFRTPGMKFHLPELEEARAAGAAVTSEMEVFFDLCPCHIIAVTGSDGKTTTTSIIAEMLRRQGYTVHIGGNIGRALLPEIETIMPEDIAVVELSSFQLISMRKSPDTAVITNITPNHLDMHKDMEEYISSKMNIIEHQNAFARAVLNLDNAITKEAAAKTRGACMMFSRRETVGFGAYLDSDGSLCYSDRTGVEKIMSKDDILIPGMHNVENYLAAICAVWGLVNPGIMQDVAKTFTGVEHRIEFIRELHGVKYYNDSIATTPTRTIAGLNSFNQKVILIAGGYDKRIPFDVLGPKVVEKVKLLLTLGATADKIEAAVKNAPGYASGSPEIRRVSNLGEAVFAAFSAANPGDIVTLSPACASFDMFKNFETRGEVFKELIRNLR